MDFLCFPTNHLIIKEHYWEIVFITTQNIIKKGQTNRQGSNIATSDVSQDSNIGIFGPISNNQSGPNKISSKEKISGEKLFAIVEDVSECQSLCV